VFDGDSAMGDRDGASTMLVTNLSEWQRTKGRTGTVPMRSRFHKLGRYHLPGVSRKSPVRSVSVEVRVAKVFARAQSRPYRAGM